MILSDNYDNSAEVKTGTGVPILKFHPEFIEDAEVHEAIAIPSENILEENCKREAERLAHQENLMNRVVYDSIDPSPHVPDNDQPLDDLPPYYVPSGEEDCTLVFESRFESGNLRRAVQVYEYEYDLILKPDYNTRGNTQWYYFSVSNTQPNRPYRFNIINMMKPDSLYNYGMRPLCYSVKDAAANHKGWRRCGESICYYQNNIRRKSGGFYYTLTFVVQFGYSNDTVYFAHCYPYTYTDLRRYLDSLTNDPNKRTRIRRKSLCQTMAGNDCELITITSFKSEPDAIKNRKGVVLMSRVHPGETNASWMMRGFLDYLTGSTLDAKILRDNFVFKIIPMINPDGVINGSYRCGLAGLDLNRVWIDPNRKLNPTIFHAKGMIRKFCEDREVIMCCDLHGHSRKKNIFMYGCTGKTKLRERIFPKLLEKKSEIFSFNDCAFGLQKSKEGTARIVMYKEMNIINSYTLESSFCGSDFGKRSDHHFTIEDLKEIGRNFCDALLDFCDPDQTLVKVAFEELESMYPKPPEDETEEDIPESEGSSDENKNRKKKKKKILPRKKLREGDKRKK
jgi:hypothetical protein